MTLKVGDEVVEIRNYGGRREGVVTKVARKYATVEYPSSYGRVEAQYDKETGRARSVGGYEGIGQVLTAEMIAERDERAALLTRLRNAGIVTNGRSGDALTLAQLRAVVQVVEDGAA